MCEGGFRAPWQIARRGDAHSIQQLAHRKEIGEGGGHVALGSAQPAAAETKHRRGDRTGLGQVVERCQRRLGGVEVALVVKRLDEHAAVQRAVHPRGRQVRRIQRRPRVGLCGAEVAAPECEPASHRQARCNHPAVPRAPRAVERTVDDRGHLVVALGDEERERGAHEQAFARYPWTPRDARRSGLRSGQRARRKIRGHVGRFVRERCDERRDAE